VETQRLCSMGKLFEEYEAEQIRQYRAEQAADALQASQEAELELEAEHTTQMHAANSHNES